MNPLGPRLLRYCQSQHAWVARLFLIARLSTRCSGLSIVASLGIPFRFILVPGKLFICATNNGLNPAFGPRLLPSFVRKRSSYVFEMCCCSTKVCKESIVLRIWVGRIVHNAPSNVSLFRASSVFLIPAFLYTL